jgi:hypothetical protein
MIKEYRPGMEYFLLESKESVRTRLSQKEEDVRFDLIKWSIDENRLELRRVQYKDIRSTIRVK